MKISLHRALVQIKTTELRLQKLTDMNNNENIFIAVMDRGANTTTGGLTKKDAERRIKADFDQFNALYKNLLILKKAVMQANAGIGQDVEVRRVTLCGDRYTLAEILAAQKTLRYKENFLNLIKNKYAVATQQIASRNNLVQARLDKMIESMGGGDKSKVNPADIQSTTEWFMANNGYELLDPLNILDCISKLEKEINEFKIEADAAISQENALTTIEVNLQG